MNNIKRFLGWEKVYGELIKEHKYVAELNTRDVYGIIQAVYSDEDLSKYLSGDTPIITEDLIKSIEMYSKNIDLQKIEYEKISQKVDTINKSIRSLEIVVGLNKELEADNAKSYMEFSDNIRNNNKKLDDLTKLLTDYIKNAPSNIETIVSEPSTHTETIIEKYYYMGERPASIVEYTKDNWSNRFNRLGEKSVKRLIDAGYTFKHPDEFINQLKTWQEEDKINKCGAIRKLDEILGAQTTSVLRDNCMTFAKNGINISNRFLTDGRYITQRENLEKEGLI